MRSSVQSPRLFNRAAHPDGTTGTRFKRSLFRHFTGAYRLTRWLRRRFTVAGRFLASALLLAILFSGSEQYGRNFGLCALMVALLLCAWLGTAWQHPRLIAHRRLPRCCTRGEPLHYPLHIQNSGDRALSQIRVDDELRERFPNYQELCQALPTGHAGTNFFDRWLGYPEWLALLRRNRGAQMHPAELAQRLPAGAQATVRMQCVPQRRGWLHFERIRCRLPDLLGLCCSQSVSPAPASLLCLPRRYPVAKIQLAGTSRSRTETTLQQRAGRSTDFLYLRDYRPGDPARHIHWPSYARRQELAVREFAREEGGQQGLFIDNSALSPIIDQEPFEAAVSVAASLAAPLTASSDACPSLLIANGELYAGSPWTTEHSRMSMLEVLACLELVAKLNFSDAVAPLRQCRSRLDSLIGVFTGWDSERQSFYDELSGFNCRLFIFIVAEEISGSAVRLKRQDKCFHLHPRYLQRDLGQLK